MIIGELERVISGVACRGEGLYDEIRDEMNGWLAGMDVLKSRFCVLNSGMHYMELRRSSWLEYHVG